ncbi:MAG: cbb3-type cytochrome oxidase assembly protein CcoS [Flavobacteriales bacterium]|nr:cbb3-type cytochrome oxidase assembly protein CcoS [Flavobacteriales bacterium]
MSVIFLLLTVSTLVATVFLAGFIWAVRKGQYDDDRSPAVRILMDDGVREKTGDRGRECEGADAAPSRTPSPSHPLSLTPLHSSPAQQPSSTSRPTHHPAQPVVP